MTKVYLAADSHKSCQVVGLGLLAKIQWTPKSGLELRLPGSLAFINKIALICVFKLKTTMARCLTGVGSRLRLATTFLASLNMHLKAA